MPRAQTATFEMAASALTISGASSRELLVDPLAVAQEHDLRPTMMKSLRDAFAESPAKSLASHNSYGATCPTVDVSHTLHAQTHIQVPDSDAMESVF